MNATQTTNSALAGILNAHAMMWNGMVMGDYDHAAYAVEMDRLEERSLYFRGVFVTPPKGTCPDVYLNTDGECTAIRWPRNTPFYYDVRK